MGGLLFLLIIVPGAVFGAPENPNPTWDLKTVYHSALEKTETVATQNATTQQAREREWQATGRILPQLNFIGTYLRQDPGSALNAFSREEQTTTRLNVVQPLFRGFGEFAERRSRLAVVKAQEKAADQAKLTLFENVARAYFGLLAAEKDLVTLTELKSINDKRIQELVGRVRIGRSRAADRLSAEAQTASLEAQIAAATTTRDQARETFRFATGIATPVTLQEPSAEVPERLAPLEEWLARVPARPDLQSRQALVESSDESIAVARAGHFPSLDLGANYYFQRAGILADSKWDVTLSLVFPIFQGGVTQAGVREAYERRKEQELLLANQKRKAETEIRSLHQEVRGHLQQYNALRRALELVERNYQQQERDYRFGLSTHLEVIQAMNTLQETRRLHDKNSYAAHAALAALRAAVGETP